MVFAKKPRRLIRSFEFEIVIDYKVKDIGTASCDPQGVYSTATA